METNQESNGNAASNHGKGTSDNEAENPLDACATHLDLEFVDLLQEPLVNPVVESKGHKEGEADLNALALQEAAHEVFEEMPQPPAEDVTGRSGPLPQHTKTSMGKSKMTHMQGSSHRSQDESVTLGS